MIGYGNYPLSTPTGLVRPWLGRAWQQVVGQLAARLPLPVPDPQFVGRPSARYPWPFFGARLLPGGELADSKLPDARRARAATSVGTFLRRLHDPGLVPQVADAGLPVDPMRRASPAVRAARAREVLDRLAGCGIWPGDNDVWQLLGRAERETAGASPAVLADEAGLAPGGTAAAGGREAGDDVSRDGAATGVIDWGDLCLGDAAVDLSIAYSGFAGRARADLLSAYARPIGPRRELAARTLAISLAASLAEYAASDRRPVLLHESLAGLRRAVTA